MTKKKRKSDKARTGSIVVTVDKAVVLDMTITARGSFLSDLLSGIATGASSMTGVLQGMSGCGPRVASLDDFLKSTPPPVSPMTKEEIDELIKKYSATEEK